MADSVGGGMMTGDHFSNSLYKGKMAQKWPKMTIKWLKWSNWPQIGPYYVFVGLLWIFKILVKSAYFWSIFGKKPVFFSLDFSGKKLKREFHPENLSPPSVLIRLVPFFIKMLFKLIQTKNRKYFFYFCHFWIFMRPQSRLGGQKMISFPKIIIFCPPERLWRLIKIQKWQKSKKKVWSLCGIT